MAALGPEMATLELRLPAQRPVPLLFVREDGRFYVIPSAGTAGWFRDALGAGGAMVQLGDAQGLACAAREIVDPIDSDRVRERFRAKYGETTFRTHFAEATRLLELDPHRPVPALRPAERLREEFDRAAEGYDRALAEKPVERYLKDRAIPVFERIFRGADPLLEIGPGTGYHTLPLLAGGHRLIVVDVSTGMLGELHRRASAAGLDGRLERRTGRLGELDRVTADLPNGAIGGAFSAFGAFNLEPELPRAATELARLVRPGGRLAFVALNRPALAPIAWEIASGRPRAAASRLTERVPGGRGHYPLELTVRTAAAWDRLLRVGFRRVGTQAISAIAPPFDPDWVGRLLPTPMGRQRARRWDARIASAPMGPLLAEWVLLDYERRPDRGTAQDRHGH
ncbi:MAG TPA: class I SAM-dependent methyltransferase [Thermoplasmata archaeon]|nr:class I SAM-dependent methyltransferase [Thermoplasmata archaeon]